MVNTTPKRDPAYLESCPVVYSLNILSKKWLIPIICELNQQPVMRFSDLLRSINGITSMMLAQSLKELQSVGLISRIQYNEMPLRVEYSLTDTARDLMPSVFDLARWSAGFDGCKADDQLCTNSACPAHNVHLINLKESELSTSTKAWDDSFVEANRLILENSPEMDAIEKLESVMEYTMQKSTELGEEVARLRTIYYVIGEDRSEQFMDSSRPAFTILRSILEEGRAQGIITEHMSDDEIIYSFMSFKHGLCAYWELERGSFDIIERNRVAIHVFAESFRKRCRPVSLPST